MCIEGAQGPFEEIETSWCLGSKHSRHIDWLFWLLNPFCFSLGWREAPPSSNVLGPYTARKYEASCSVAVLAGHFKEFGECTLLQHLPTGTCVKFGKAEDAWDGLPIRGDQRGGPDFNVYKSEEEKDARSQWQKNLSLSETTCT